MTRLGFVVLFLFETIAVPLFLFGQEIIEGLRGHGPALYVRGETILRRDCSEQESGHPCTPLTTIRDNMPDNGFGFVSQFLITARGLPEENFGGAYCFQANASRQEETMNVLCSGFYFEEDVDEETAVAASITWRAQRVNGIETVRILHISDSDGLAVFDGTSGWIDGVLWADLGDGWKAHATDAFPKPVILLGRDGVVRAKGFEIIGGLHEIQRNTDFDRLDDTQLRRARRSTD